MLNSKRKLKSVMYGHTMKWAGDQKSKATLNKLFRYKKGSYAADEKYQEQYIFNHQKIVGFLSCVVPEILCVVVRFFMSCCLVKFFQQMVPQLYFQKLQL